jgi:hypothetical protein
MLKLAKQLLIMAIQVLILTSLMLSLDQYPASRSAQTLQQIQIFNDARQYANIRYLKSKRHKISAKSCFARRDKLLGTGTTTGFLLRYVAAFCPSPFFLRQ